MFIQRRWFRRHAIHSWNGGFYLAAALLCLGFSSCASTMSNNVDDMLQPSNDRNWTPDMAELPYAKIRGDKVKIYNVRQCAYLDQDTYVVNHYDRTYNLDDLEAVDFIVVPFKDTPSLAHTMLTFVFSDERYLAASVEVRLEEGESYSPVGGSMRQFEIMYVLADERDVVLLRTEHRKSDVYVYRTQATPEKARELFLDVLKRVNSLKKQPEFYDTFTNNCTTNIVSHVNRVMPGRLPFWDPASLLTGYSDRAAYLLGFLVDYGSFEETRRRAHINHLANTHADDPRFSQLIRTEQSKSQIAQTEGEEKRR